MSIEQNIIDAVSISKVTKLPVLFMSNPGLGKTTIMKRYAQKQGMHLETLIGSRFTPEEISGYQVNNGGDHLVHMNPEWYSRILEKQAAGVETLLFIDELSTCSEAVQGSLLSLIFDRSIGSGKKLPENCMIVSAANYAANLPAVMNIMAPTLNRFVIINLNENYTGIDLLEEFLNPAKEPTYHEHKPLSPEDEEKFMESFRKSWKEIFVKYSDTESALGILDIANPGLDGLYTDSGNFVYNFISGRTVYYLSLALKAYKELGIKNTDILNKICDGLVGAGTCSFKEAKQGKSYRSFVHRTMGKLLNAKIVEKPTKIELVNDISADVAAYFTNRENLEFTAEDNLKQLVELVHEVTEKFTVNNILKLCVTETEIAKFISDLDAIFELQQFVQQYPDAKNIYEPLKKIGMNYYSLYCDMLGIWPDYGAKFGETNNLFERSIFIKRINDEGKRVTSRAAVRFQSGSRIPSFYLIGPEETFLEANMKTMLRHSDIKGVIVFDKEFKIISVDDYIEKIKSM